MNIIVLDVHHPEDGRVNRHIKYMHNLGYNVVHFNVNRYFPFLEPGFFSKYGEKGFRIPVGDSSQSLKNRLLLHFLFITPILALNLIFLLKKSFLENNDSIIHVHDYELLFTGHYLRFFLSHSVKIVYDRHELFETSKGDKLLFDKIPRIYEKFSSRWIDGIIGVSEDHVLQLRDLFKRSIVIIVPNYSDASGYSIDELNEKITNIDSNIFNLVYFGSLDVTLDRDIPLILKVMEFVLKEWKSSEAYIGGLTSNSFLLSMFSELNQKFPGRFHYLGYVSYDNVLYYSSKATIGFLCLKKEYWVLVSANKVYEYLHYGVIPVIKANIENQEAISKCSILFRKDVEDEIVISSVGRLINNKEKMKRMLMESFELGKQYSFENVKQRYHQLYLDLVSDQ
ncbi:glycosyltransferase [Methanospirillum stamsii]|uniref:Glycosyltransferase subfamily 4-like N-terminal domain-containing protein n=1 Tax=Methanospirillum stamsii TaxID=1277351 RepID=A0A2V2N012_9EURY|nr:glycosyltransferase [Methanospirillum stamsii]PWR69497.1 hypothetical protein DLD82_17915 [Methanospirillum stamsii]